MKRRKFLTGGVIGAAGVVAACSQPGGGAKTFAVNRGDKIKWRMTTTWPKDLPGLGTGANLLAKRITDMSGGRLEVEVFGGGELVPSLEAFDAVSKGTAQMGHGAAYYWKGKSPAMQFFAAVPFGLSAQEMNAWIYYGGGQKLWDDLYSDFDLKPFLAGNTGVQMGGWFRREINKLEDLKGLRIRIPGLGGDVLSAVGATPRLLPGGEVFTALESGALDAAEWGTPYNDLAFGFYKIAKFYYYPGWQEPGTALECFVNKTAYYGLPPDLQRIVAIACQAANTDMFAEFTARNGDALNVLTGEHGAQLRRFPDEMLLVLAKLSGEVVADLASADAAAKKVYDSFAAFRRRVSGWTKLSETAYSLARSRHRGGA